MKNLLNPKTLCVSDSGMQTASVFHFSIRLQSSNWKMTTTRSEPLVKTALIL